MKWGQDNWKKSNQELFFLHIASLKNKNQIPKVCEGNSKSCGHVQENMKEGILCEHWDLLF